MVMLVLPIELEDVISVIPAIRPNCLSSGVATDDAIISGLAPGRPACTRIVGKSICGSGETGRTLKATAPARAMPMVSNVGATGRLINGADTFMASPAREHPLGRSLASERVRIARRGDQRRYKSRASYRASKLG